MRKYILLLIVMLSLTLFGCSKKAVVEAVDIIPEPNFVVLREGNFVLDRSTKFSFRNLSQNNETVKYITRSLRKLHLHPVLSIGKQSDDFITFALNDTINTELGEEGYLMEIRDEGVLISANTEAGLFYGYQSFIQILPSDMSNVRYSRISLPQCTILDAPRFSWRGSHLDVARHFFTIKEIKRHLDLMAAYKLNKFHWHLSDDQGWRIEIEKYPELNYIGSWRDSSKKAKGDDENADEQTDYGGFYTKEEIREVVDYAASLHIDIIPEIVIPSHCSAILASYPELGCPNREIIKHVPSCLSDTIQASLCLGDDTVLQFLRDIFDEIIDLFPYEYIHIGGYETNSYVWSYCPKCQRRIIEQGLRDTEELAGWLIREMEQYLTFQGRHIIGADPLIRQGVSKQAIIQSYNELSAAHDATKAGYRVILSTADPLDISKTLMDSNNFVLRRIYHFDPIPANLSPVEVSRIIGGECTLWTPCISTYKEAECLLQPTILAVSELFWTQQEKRDWDHFRHKVDIHNEHLAKMGYRH